MKKNQAVLVIIKPDGVYRNLEGHVLNKFSHAQLQMIGAKVVRPSKNLVELHYEHIKTKPFFNDVVEYLLGKYHHNAAVMAIVYSGSGAVDKCREIAGATNPEEADSASVRASFGRITTKGVYENVVHVSSDDKEAEREIKLWFKPEEILLKLYSEKQIQSSKERAWK